MNKKVHRITAEVDESDFYFIRNFAKSKGIFPKALYRDMIRYLIRQMKENKITIDKIFTM